MPEYIDYFRYLLYAAEFTAAAAGILNWQKVKGTYWKWFVIYLVFIFLSELAGEILFHIKAFQELHRAWYVIIVIPVEFIIFQWLFYRSRVLSKPLLSFLILSTLFILIYFIELIVSKRMWIPSIGYSLGAFSLLFVCISYLGKLVQSEALLHFKSELLFWISAGLLVFYIGSMPFYALPQSFVIQVKDILNTYGFIPNLMSTFMYILFALGLRWKDSESYYF